MGTKKNNHFAIFVGTCLQGLTQTHNKPRMNLSRVMHCLWYCTFINMPKDMDSIT